MRQYLFAIITEHKKYFYFWFPLEICPGQHHLKNEFNAVQHDKFYFLQGYSVSDDSKSLQSSYKIVHKSSGMYNKTQQKDKYNQSTLIYPASPVQKKKNLQIHI